MDIATVNLDLKDIIIAVMGPTGAGKSNFIDILTGQPGLRSSKTLGSFTNRVQGTVLTDYEKEQGHRVVLVDTPGFDDTYRSDMEILTMVSQWLKETYKKKIKLSGVIYMHRITDNRMGGTPLKNLHMFGELCGDAAMPRVILVTTMWDQVVEEVGVQRELELKKNFWNLMLAQGSQVARSDNSYDGARVIIGKLVAEKKAREALLLQEELVDLKKRLNETHAGQMIYSNLQRLLEDQRTSMEKLMSQISAESGGSASAAIIQQLHKDQEKIEEELKNTIQNVRLLKVPLTRRIMLLLCGKKGKIKAISSPDIATDLSTHDLNLET